MKTKKNKFGYVIGINDDTDADMTFLEKVGYGYIGDTIIITYIRRYASLKHRNVIYQSAIKLPKEYWYHGYTFVHT